MHDTPSSIDLPGLEPSAVTSQVSRALLVVPAFAPPAVPEPVEPTAKRGPGRLVELSEPHLWLGLLWAVLEGLGG